MKKNFIMLITIIILSINSLSNNIETREERERRQYGKNTIVVGNLTNIRGKGEVKVKPDIVINTFELKTKGDTIEKASEENAKTLNEFKKYLISIGVKENDIETSKYSKGSEEVKKTENEIEKIYETSFSVSLIIPNEKYYNVTEIIGKEGISDLKHTATYNNGQDREFQFIIESTDKNNDISKKLAKDKYDRIKKEFNQIGLSDPIILDFSNTDTTKDDTKKVFTITHAYTVKIPTTANIGNILKKCEALKIKNPGTMIYDMSEELREKATLEAYEKAMDNIYNKSKVILKNRGYDLGDGSFSDQTNDYIPLNDYARGGIMMNQAGLNMAGMNSEIDADKALPIDIPFSAVQEMKVTVNLIASFEIIKKSK
ncbi:SIMPL domain-containing protein [Fusobacterium sp. PH5-44]|uniref:SIMPL domain-containing protein n=1 Tax=unclassified Fusobacterium TaxID=2648384 RepID=UPI003D2206E0